MLPRFCPRGHDNIFRDIAEAKVYIDDIGVFSDSWEQHMTVLRIVLQKIQENGFSVNSLQCEWAVNSLTAKCFPAGTKNSCLEGFLLGKHKYTNIPTMMEPFSPPAAWFCWLSISYPQEPLRKGLAKATIEGF